MQDLGDHLEWPTINVINQDTWQNFVDTEREKRSILLKIKKASRRSILKKPEKK